MKKLIMLIAISLMLGGCVNRNIVKSDAYVECREIISEYQYRVDDRMVSKHLQNLKHIITQKSMEIYRGQGN